MINTKKSFLNYITHPYRLLFFVRPLNGTQCSHTTNAGVPMSWSPLVNIVYERVLSSPAVSSMYCWS